MNLRCWRIFWSLLLILLVSLFASPLRAKEAKQDEAEWSEFAKLLADPATSDASILKAAQDYLDKRPDGKHAEEAKLWKIKLGPESSKGGALSALPELDQLRTRANDRSVRAEAMFWKAKLLYESSETKQALDMFRDYLEKYPKGQRADQIYFLLSLAQERVMSRSEFVKSMRNTLNTIASKNQVELGFRLRIFPNTLDAKVVLAGNNGLSIQNKSEWFHLSGCMGSEGGFYHLIDEHRMFWHSQALKLFPYLSFTKDGFQIGLKYLSSANQNFKRVNIDREDVLRQLEDLYQRSHVKLSSYSEYYFYKVSPRPNRSLQSVLMIGFNQKNLLKTLLVRNDLGEKLVGISDINFNPKPDKSVMKAKPREKRQLSLYEISFAAAAKYLFEELEDKRPQIKHYDWISRSKPTLVRYIIELDKAIGEAVEELGIRQKLAEIESALPKAPDDANLIGQRTQYLIRLGLIDDAKQSLARYRAAYGDEPSSVLMEADLWSAEKNIARAESLLESAVAAYPDRADLLVRYAEFIAPRDLAAAMIMAKKAIQLDPSCLPAYKLLSKAYIEKDAMLEALALLETGIDKVKDPDELRCLKAYALIKYGKPGTALQTIKPILDNPPSPHWSQAIGIELIAKTGKEGIIN